MNITIKTSGFREIDRAIAKIQPEMRKSVYKAVITEGARVVLREAKSRVPKKSGLLKRSLGVLAKVYGNTPYSVIGPRRKVQGTPKIVKNRKTGKTRKSVPTPWLYARLVEYGTRTAKPTPFMRPALDASRSLVHEAFRRGLEKGLHRVARRIARKSAK